MGKVVVERRQEEYRLEDIIPTPDNRKVDTDCAAFADLVESVRLHGVLQPGLGRPHPTEPGKIDLRAGHRRLLACVTAGLEKMPVIVWEMDDREAMEVTLMENLHRQDLTPLEEAETIDRMLRVGTDAREIAAKIGKDERWVVRRHRLLQLAPCWSRELKDPEGAFFGWGVGHMEVLSKYPLNVQEQMHDRLERETWLVPRTVAGLEQVFSEYMRDLTGVPWDRFDVELLPAAGSCETCTKRSGACPGLFDSAEGVDRKDYCLDAECFTAKLEAHREAKVKALEVKHPNLVRIMVEPGRRAPGALHTYQYETVKAKSKGAVPAVVMDGPAAGELRWVKPIALKDPAPPQETEADRKGRLEAKRREHLRTQLADLAARAKRPKWYTATLALAIERELASDGLAGLARAMEAAEKPAAVLGASWNALMEEATSTMARQYDDVDDEVIEAVARLVEADLKVLRKAAAKAVTE